MYLSLYSSVYSVQNKHFANIYIYVSISTYIYTQFPLSVHA